MYLQRTTVNKDGKTHSYWRLVRSVRRGRKVVQETVAHLGELDAQGRAPGLDGWRLRSPDASSTTCSRQARRPVSRSRFAWNRFAWNERGASAMSGSAGGCGVRWDLSGSVPRTWPKGASMCRGRQWRRSW